MAIHNDYTGREDEIPGRWHPFNEDPDYQLMVELSLRPLHPNVGKKLKDKYLKPVEKEVKGKKVTRFEPDDEGYEDFLSETLAWMWLDCRGFVLEVASADNLKFFKKHIHADIEPGEEFILGQRPKSKAAAAKIEHLEQYPLTEKLKEWCIKEMPILQNYLMAFLSEAATFEKIGPGIKEQMHERALRGNSRSGSRSKPATGSRRKTGRAAGAAKSSEANASHA